MKYAVPIIYKWLSTYIVEASSPKEAERIARRLYDRGEEPEPMLPSDWQQFDRVGDIEEIKPE